MKSFRFDKSLYNKTKGLAFVSIFLTICWVAFYELDPFVISKLLGPTYLAIYAIGFSLMEYFRSIFGIIFSPFIAKFNHYIGLKDFKGLNEAFKKVLVITLPLVVFPILSISITIQNFILTWVGFQYAGSIPIARILVLGYLFNFITSPTGILIMAYEKTRILYYTNFLLPLVYWLGILFTFKYLHLQAFADFKFVAFLIITITYMNIIVRLLGIKFWKFMGDLLLPALLPVISLLLIVFFTKSYLPVQKGSLGLFIYFIYNGLVISIAIIIYYFSSKIFKDGINSIITTVFSRSTTSKKLKNLTI
jgi:O-antigen/teichoic acid export membrane protein